MQLIFLQALPLLPGRMSKRLKIRSLEPFFRPFVGDNINATAKRLSQVADTIERGCDTPLLLQECPDLSNLTLVFKVVCHDSAQRLGLLTFLTLNVSQ